VEVATKSFIEYFPNFSWNDREQLGNISVTAAGEPGFFFFFIRQLPKMPTANFSCSIIRIPATSLP